MIRGNNLFLESTYTDEEFKQVTFSQPIPVFCTPIRYQKNEQFKSRLPLYAWMFVGYIDDAPITLFFIDNNNYSKEYKYNDLMGQGVAQSCVAAMQQLGTKDVVCIPVNGFYFIADDSDNVALIKSPNDTTSYPIVSFEQLNAAVNRSINASADEEYPAAGGGVFLENLYSDNNLDVDNQSLDQLKVITTVASLVVLLVFGAFIVAKNAQRITESQHTT